MSSSLRRGALAAAALAFSITSLAACAAGNDAQTLQIKPDNAATSVGDIKIQNALVITQPDLESTGPAAISATLFNSGRTAQTLDAIKVDDTDKTAELKAAKGGSLTIPAGGRLIIGGKDNASAVLSSSREAIQDGNAQKITFTFSETGDVSLRAFVVPAESYFEGWGPTEVPAAPETASSPTGTPTGTPNAGAEATPSGGASAGSSETPGAGTEGGQGSVTATPTDAASQSAAGH
ncbi:DUF461 domain-containing protein [Streptomyces chartreusis]|uniref:DUF461 domain-containing protein n=1 Tax=Streptomyces chartreusis TaxID=1969 RepID=A0A7H8TC56_STRCX|nr:DUF461 domain-containing protein [Streptomyces chartreusis]QKZ20568.1 DUF461 domain-containing protein [Streptomyces chartreusis]